MYSETVKQKSNMMYEKSHTKNWYDFFFASFFLFILGYLSLIYYPILNLDFAFFLLGTFCLGIFLVFQEGVSDGDT